MTEEALKRIEGGLAITLPPEYRALMLARGAELRQLNRDSGGRLHEFIAASANDVLILNCSERKPISGTAGAYPKWWETFLLLGSDGGGGYFCLRLDGKPGVWMIGSDDDGKPEKKFLSLAKYVDHCVRAIRKDLKKKAE
jgi:hypothetical protein